MSICCDTCAHFQPDSDNEIQGECTAPLPDCFIPDVCMSVQLMFPDIDSYRKKMFFYEGATCPSWEEKEDEAS